MALRVHLHHSRTGPVVRRSNGRCRPPPSEPHALRQGDHPDDRGNFAHDLGPRLEGAARQVDTRFHGPWRSPAAVAVGAYLGAGVLLLVVGWLLVHTPLGGPIRDWDLTISRDLSTGRTSGWTDYSDVGTAGANTLPVIGGMVVVSLVLVALRRWRDLLFLPLGLALELSVFLTVNYLVARERPEVAQLGGEPGTHSFPSGHVAATFVLFASIVVLLGVGRWRTPYKVLGWVVAMIPVVVRRLLPGLPGDALHHRRARRPRSSASSP